MFIKEGFFIKMFKKFIAFLGFSGSGKSVFFIELV